MKSWKRITLVIFVLIGIAAFFSYWSINQLNREIDNLSASYLAVTDSVYSSIKRKAELASTSPEISGELATSTDLGLASSSPEISGEFATSTSSGQATTTDPELSFTFPQGDTQVYTGCIYPISWQSPTTINSLEIALIDAGAREPVGPIASGLAEESTIEGGSQNLKWKVGAVWPGAYYIKVSKINGVEAEFRSGVFGINELPANISTDEKGNICKESGGSF